MDFEERMGLPRKQEILQIQEIDGALRNSLWNVSHSLIFCAGSRSLVLEPNHTKITARLLWRHFFKQPIDEIPDRHFEAHRAIRRWYFDADWADIYRFIEFLVRIVDSGLPRVRMDAFVAQINTALSKENSGYRLVDGVFVAITSDEEIGQIETAIGSGDLAANHLKQALDHLADRENPDYRNSISESLLAVESRCRRILDDDSITTGQALSVLQKEHGLHAALARGYSAIYGYASDDDGIRHGMTEEPNVTADDARYFLVSCSAFSNYLRSKYQAS